MNLRRLAAGLTAAAAVALAAPAHADVDTDFAAELQGYGIYGPRDYNAWLAKVVCKRMDNGLDSDAHKSAQFVTDNLPRGTTQAQTWQFIGASVNTYCPEQKPVLERVAAEQG